MAWYSVPSSQLTMAVAASSFPRINMLKGEKALMGIDLVQSFYLEGVIRAHTCLH